MNCLLNECWIAFSYGKGMSFLCGARHFNYSNKILNPKMYAPLNGIKAILGT